MATPTREPNRREQILAAAAAKFARYGFHGVGIDDIGAAVGISGPALYRHFRGKEAVLAEMLTGISDTLLAGGRERVGGEDPAADLDRLVAWHVGFALGNPDLITVQARDLDSLGSPDRNRVRERQRAYVEVWVDVLCRLHPGLARSTARAAAHAAFGLINSTPHSTRLSSGAMTDLLHRMARAALAEVTG